MSYTQPRTKEIEELGDFVDVLNVPKMLEPTAKMNSFVDKSARNSSFLNKGENRSFHDPHKLIEQIGPSKVRFIMNTKNEGIFELAFLKLYESDENFKQDVDKHFKA